MLVILVVANAAWASASFSFATTVPLQPGPDSASTNSAAIDAALDHANAGDIIQFPRGTFSISSPVILRSAVSIAGAGQDDTVLLAGFRKLQPMISAHGISNVELRDFTLDGSGDANVIQGIELNKSTLLNLHHLAIINFPGSDQRDAPLGPHAIDCTTGVTSSSFDSITCRSIGIGRTWGAGIRLSWGSSSNRISNCTIDNTGRGGIFCNDGSTDNIIVDNKVSGSGGVGLGIEVQNSDRTLIERNSIDHWLSLDNSSMSALRGNTISADDPSPKLCGIEIVDSHDVIVSGNSVLGGAKVGLSISGPKPKQRLLITNNVFQKCTTWGAQIQGEAGGASELYLDHNRFTDARLGPEPLYPNQGHGVRINGNARSITFDQNEISHNAGAGIQLTGSGIDELAFYQNVITENRGGVVDGDPIVHLVWLENQAPAVPTHWIQSAQRVDRPIVRVQIEGARYGVSGSDCWTALQGSELHFLLAPNQSLVPVVGLWDMGRGLPLSGTSADRRFENSGEYTIECVMWDAGGRAAKTKLEIRVCSPPFAGGNSEH